MLWPLCALSIIIRMNLHNLWWDVDFDIFPPEYLICSLNMERYDNRTRQALHTTLNNFYVRSLISFLVPKQKPLV